MSKTPEHDPTVDLWNCPCGECTKMDWKSREDGDHTSLKAHRLEWWPAEWQAFYTSKGGAS